MKVHFLHRCSDQSNEGTVLHIAEETDDDVTASTPTTHTTEDLFTIIHRFERAHTFHHGVYRQRYYSRCLSSRGCWKGEEENYIPAAQMLSGITRLPVGLL